MDKKDALRAVREIREKISAEFDNDPKKLIAHYIEEQKRHKDRLLRSSRSRETDATGQQESTDQ